MKHLETNNITCSEQFGLRNEHSCESQLLVAINVFPMLSRTNYK